MHDMGARFVALYPYMARMAVSKEFDKLDDFEFMLPTEFLLLERYVKVLEPLANFVRTLEGEDYLTIALLPVLYCRCFNACNDQPSDPQPVKDLKRTVRNQLDHRLGYVINEPNIALVGCALHPAFGHLRFVSEAVAVATKVEAAQWTIDFPPPQRAANVGTFAPIKIDVDLNASRVRLDNLHNHFTVNGPPEAQQDPFYIPPMSELNGGRYDALHFWKV
jgi:hypothetical protein